MKIAALPKIVGASVLALSLASLPATAQTTTTPDTTTTAPNTTTTTPDTATGTGYATTVERDQGFDWGWLGLIGLAGLAGLAGKKREEPVRYRDPDTVSSTTYRE